MRGTTAWGMQSGGRWIAAATGTVVFLALFVAYAMPAQGLTCPVGSPTLVNWAGGGATTSWADPLNWDTGSVPDETNDVCIEPGSQVTVLVDAAEEAQSLVSNANTTINLSSSGELTLANQSEIAGDLSIVSGTLNGGVDLTLGGSTTLQNGDMAGTITNLGAVEHTWTGSLTLAGTFTNEGTFRLTNTGDLQLDDSVATTFINEGTFEFTSNAGNVARTFGGTIEPVFTNSTGTVVKSAGTGTSAFSNGVDFANDGTIDVQAGRLNIDSLVSSAPRTFSVATGSVLAFKGDDALLTGEYSVTGGGLVEWAGGSFDGTAVVLAFPAASPLRWGSVTSVIGTFTNTGVVEKSAGGDTDLYGSFLNDVGSEFRITGGFGIELQKLADPAGPGFAPTTFTNEGLFDFALNSGRVTGQGCSAAETANGCVDPSFQNNGTMRKSTGTSITSASTVFAAVDFENNGVLEVTAGRLDIDGLVSSAATPFQVAVGTALELTGKDAAISGTYTATGGGEVRVAGSWQATNVTLDFDSPALQWIYAADFIGTITNAGSIDFDQTSTQSDIVGTFTNDGIITFSSSGDIGLDGNSPGTEFINNGLIEFVGDGARIWRRGSADRPTFTNTLTGRIRNRVSAGTSTFGLGVDFDNEGTIEIDAGALQIQGLASTVPMAFDVAAGAQLELTGADAQLQAGTYSSTPGGGPVIVKGGTFLGSGLVFDFDSPALQWETGSINGGTPAAGDATNVGNIDAAFGQVLVGGSFTNATGGTIRHTGNSSLRLYAEADFANAGLHEFSNNEDVSRYLSGPNPTYTNTGILRKAEGASRTEFQISVEFINEGAIQVAAGELRVAGLVSSTPTTFEMANDAHFEWYGVNGTVDGLVSGQFSATGAGTVEWQGYYTVDAPLTLDFAPGVFTLDATVVDASGTTIANDGELTWRSGELIGDVTNNGTVFSAALNWTLDGSLVNEAGAEIYHSGRTLYLERGASPTTLTNHGLYEIESTVSWTAFVTASGSGSEPTFVNSSTGTLRAVREPTAGTVTVAQSVDFSNDGVVEVADATLYVSGDVAQLPGTTLTDGTWRVLDGSQLNFGNSASITEIGSGATVVLSGVDSVPAIPVSAEFVPLADLTTNSGSLTITDGASFSTIGDLTSSGELVMGRAGLLNVSGDFTASAPSDLHIEVSDTSANDGFGQIDVRPGNADLLGTIHLDLIPPFVPVDGDPYDVILWDTQTGTPAVIDPADVFTEAFLADRLRLNEATNEKPVISPPIGDQSGDEHALITFTAFATGPEPGDTLTYTLEGSVPTGAAIDPVTGVFTWTPNETQDGADQPFVVRVTDDGDPIQHTDEPILITVDEVNEPPYFLTPVAPQEVAEEVLLQFPVEADDVDFVDGLPNTLRFQLVDSPPTGASIGLISGVFSWTPTEEQVGPTSPPLNIRIRVYDDGTPEKEAFLDVEVTVLETNGAPEIDPAPSPQAVNEGSEVVVDVNASDTDVPPNALEFSLGGSPPANATIDSVTGLLSWTPEDSDDGQIVTVVVTETDTDPALSDQASFVVTVNNLDPTVVASDGDQVTPRQALFSLTGVTYSDPGTGDTHRAEIDWGDGTVDDCSVVPTCAVVSDGTGTGTGTVTGTHVFSADRTVTITVFDDDGGSGSASFQVTVVNSLPTAVANGPYQLYEGSTEQLSSAGSTDIDGTVTAWGWAPPGVSERWSIDDQAAESPTVTGLNDWTGTITLTVTDNDSSNSDPVDATLTVLNADPVVTVGPIASIPEGSLLVLSTASFTDPGTFDTHTATVDWGDTQSDPGDVTEPNGPDPGTVTASHAYEYRPTPYPLTVIVTDSDEGSHQATVNVTVTDVPGSISVTNTPAPGEVSEPGGDVDFTVVVRNTSLVDDVTVDSVVDPLLGGDISAFCSPSLPATLGLGEAVTCNVTDVPITGQPGPQSTTATATGTDDDGQPVSADGEASVTITDVVSSVLVSKTADVSSVDETGGDVTFTFVVDNTSVADEVTIDSLVDDVLGDLDGQGDCSVPQTIAVGGSYSCAVTESLSGTVAVPHSNTVTASGLDDDGVVVSGGDGATVSFIDVLPDVSVSKTPSVTEVTDPGGDVTFTFVVTNNSLEDATLDSLLDDQFGDLNGQGDCSVPQPLVGDGGSYTCAVTKLISGAAGDTHTNVVTATASDDEDNPDIETATATINIVGPASIVVTKSVDMVSLPEPGGNVVYTVTVENTSAVDDVTINSVDDPLLGGDVSAFCDLTVPAVLAPGELLTCMVPHTISGRNAGDVVTNTVNVAGVDGGAEPVFGSGEASVTITDVVSSVLVSKTADVSSVDETGGDVTFTFVVDNTSVADEVTIDSLVDDVLGDLDGQGDCSVPQTIAVGGSYSCAVTESLSGTVAVPHSNTVTASGLDDDGVVVSGGDGATVSFIDVLPDVSVSKTPSVTEVTDPGGDVTFTFVVTNNSLEDATLDSLLDDQFGDLNGQGDCSVPQPLVGDGGSYTCAVTKLISGAAGDTHTNVVTATASDDEDNPDIETATATINIVAAGVPPDPQADTYVFAEGVGGRVLDVLENDGPAGASLEITSATPGVLPPGSGSVACDAEQCIFNASPGFTGTATFDYTVQNGTLTATGSVSITVNACPNPMGAFDEQPGLVTGYQWIECASTGANETTTSPPTSLITPTGSLLHMTNGLAANSYEPQTVLADDVLGTSYRGASDVSVLRLDLEIPEDARCLVFDVVFASEEYPDFVNAFNDGFLAEFGDSTWIVSGNTINAPDNFATDDGEYLSTRASFFDEDRVVEANGMVYGGASPLLQARKSIHPPSGGPWSVALYLSIFDAGIDAEYNSAALVENLRVLQSPCEDGTGEPPDAFDDGPYQLDEDRSAELDVLGNDVDNDDDPITVLRVITPPQHGSAWVTADRTAIRYVPDPNYYGTDSFEYEATDNPNAVGTGGGIISQRSVATVDIDLSEINDTPIAWGDRIDAPVGTPVTFDVVANDYENVWDRNFGDTLTIASFDDSTARGSVDCVIGGTECTFTAADVDPDFFRYTISDNRLGDERSSTAWVYVNREDPVDPNLPPVVDAGDTYEAVACPVEDEPCTPLPLTGTADDPDGSVVSVQWTALTSADVTITNADTLNAGLVTRNNGVFRVRLTATDNEGATSSSTALVTAFAAEWSDPNYEGSTASVDVDFFNPGGDLQTTITWGDGESEIVPFSIFPFTKSHLYPQDGSNSVEVCISGTTVEGPINTCDQQQLEVLNVLPTVNAGVDRWVLPGVPFSQGRMSFDDPGADAPWKATVKWDAASPEQLLADDLAEIGRIPTATHTYATVTEPGPPHVVEVCVEDDDDRSCDTFEVVVSNNVPPIAAAGSGYSGFEGSPITLSDAGSYDPDGGAIVSWQWTATDPRVTLDDATTGTATLTATDNGSFAVTLQVCDDGGACSDGAVTTVEVDNVEPTISAGPTETPVQGATVTVGATYADDGEADTHTATINWVDGSSDGVAEAGVISGTYMYDTPGTRTIEICVIDDDNNAPSLDLVCTTQDVIVGSNQPPILDPIGDDSIPEGDPYAFTATADPTDGIPESLSFSLSGDVPDGATIDSVTGDFAWTPTEVQGPADYTFDVVVSDGAATDSETITLTVDEVNDAPDLLWPIGDLGSIAELDQLSFTATATDPDRPDNTLTFSLSGAPAGASIDAETGVFVWRPTEAQGRPLPYTFDVIVTDDGVPAATDFEPITVTVTETISVPGCPVGGVTWIGVVGDWSLPSNWTQDPATFDASTDICIPVGAQVTVDTDAEANTVLSLGDLVIPAGASLTVHGASETSGLDLSGQINGPGELVITDSGLWSEGWINGPMRVGPAATLQITGVTNKDLTAPLTNDGLVVQSGSFDSYAAGLAGSIINNVTWQLEDGGFLGWPTTTVPTRATFVNNGTLERLNAADPINQAKILGDVVNNGTIDVSAGRLWLYSMSEMNDGSNLNADTGTELMVYATGVQHSQVVNAAGTTTITGDGYVSWITDLVIDPGAIVDAAGGDIELQAANVSGEGLLSVSGALTWLYGAISADVEVVPLGLLSIRGDNGQTVTSNVTNDGLVIQEVPVSLSDAGVAATVTNNETWRLYTAPTFTPVYGTLLTGDPAVPATFINNGTFQRDNRRDPGTEVRVGAGVDFETFGTVTVNRDDFVIENVTVLDGGILNADTDARLRLDAALGGVEVPRVVPGVVTVTGDGAVEWGNHFILKGEVTGPNTLLIADQLSWTFGEISGSVEITPAGTLDFPNNASKYVTGLLTNNGTVDHEGSNLVSARGTVPGTIVNNSEWFLTSPTNRTNFASEGTVAGTFVNNGLLERSNAATPDAIAIMNNGVDLENNGTVRAVSGRLQIDSAPSHYSGVGNRDLTGGSWTAAGGSTLLLPGAIERNFADIVVQGAGSSIPELSDLAVNANQLEILGGATFATNSDLANTGNLVVGNAGPPGAPSVLTVNGDFATSLQVRYYIGGAEADGLYGRIDVTGQATLGGNVDFLFFNGYTPVATDSYTVMTYTAQTGAFTFVTGVPTGFDLFVEATTATLAAVPPIPGCPAGGIAWGGGDGNWSDATNWSSDPLLPTSADDACIPADVVVTVDADAEVNSLLSLGEVVVLAGNTLNLGNTSTTSTLALAGEIAGVGQLTIVDSGVWSEGLISGSVEVGSGATLEIPHTSLHRDLTGALTNEGVVSQAGTSVRPYVSGVVGTLTNNGLWRLTGAGGPVFSTTDSFLANRGTFVNNGVLERDAAPGPGALTATLIVDLVNNGIIDVSSGGLQPYGNAELNDGSTLNADTGTLLQFFGLPSGGQGGTVVTVNGTSSITGDGEVELYYYSSFDLQPGAQLDSTVANLKLTGDVAGDGQLSVLGGGQWSGRVPGNLHIAASGTLEALGGASATGAITNEGAVVQRGPISLSSGGVAATVTNNATWRMYSAPTGPEAYGNYLTGDVATPATFVNNATLERRNDRDPDTEVLIGPGVNVESNGTITVDDGTFTIESVSVLDGGALDAGAGATLHLDSALPGTPVTGNLAITGVGTVEFGDQFDLLGDITGPNTLHVVGTTSWSFGTIAADVEVAPGGVLVFPDNAIKSLTGTLTNNGIVGHDGSNLSLSLAGDAGSIINNGTWSLESATNRTNLTSDGTAQGTFVNNGFLIRDNAATPGAFVVMDNGVDLVNNNIVEVLSGELRIGSAVTHFGGGNLEDLSGGIWAVRSNSTLNLPRTIETNGAHLILDGPGASMPGLFEGRVGLNSTNAGRIELLNGADLSTVEGFTNLGDVVLGNDATTGDLSTLTVNGDFTNDLLSILTMQIGGSPVGQLQGRIDVTGTANLDGPLTLEFPTGYTPDRTESYDLITYTSSVGGFSSVTGAPAGFDVFVTPTAATLAENDPDYAYGIVGAGGSVGTDQDVTAGNPLSVTVDTPGGGTIEIDEETPVLATPPAGYDVVGVYYADISAPTESVADPLLISFRIDSTVWSGTPADEITVMRDGVPVPDCDLPGTTGPADADPCVGDRSIVDSDLVILVRSSVASEWVVVRILAGVTITAPADGSPYVQGDPVSFAGVASDGAADVSASLEWASDLDGAIGSGATFERTDLTVGTHVVTATYTDTFGVSVADSVVISVAPPGAVATLTVEFPGVDGVRVDVYPDDGVPDTVSGTRIARLKGQTDAAVFADLPLGTYDVHLKKGGAILIVDGVSVAEDATVGDLVATLTVDLETLSGITVQVRTSDGSTDTTGTKVETMKSQSGVVTVDVLKGTYEVVLKKKKAVVVIDPIDCATDCGPGDIVETLTVDLGTATKAKIEVRTDDGAVGTVGDLVVRLRKQSGIVVIDVLRSTYDVVIVAGGTTTVFDAVDCVTGPGFVLLE